MCYTTLPTLCSQPKARGARDDGVDQYDVFVSMENLLDKLKILDYDTLFCTQEKMKPLSR